MNKTYHNLSVFASTPLRAPLALHLFDSTIHTTTQFNQYIKLCSPYHIVFVFSLQITADFYEKEDIDNNDDDDNNNNNNNDSKPTFEPIHIHIHEYRIRYENAFEICSTNEKFPIE